MACPGVSGVMATLYEAYRQNNNSQDPHAGLMKAIVLNTAEDLGNSGPDFRFGYGRINARQAL
ncbi:MAG: S8 family serine peptidase [Owenweeksia sp.]|nr:S8 family serine peptidase [Owenweeksia sp.]